MPSSIEKALAGVARSYHAAKATVSQAKPGDVMVNQSTGSIFGAQSNSMSTAKAQLESFRSWVYAAVRPICNVIAAQPVEVSRPTRKIVGSKAATVYEPIEQHPIVRLLADPSELQTGYSLMWATVASICLTGRGYWWVPEGEPLQCLMIPPSWVKSSTGTTKFESWEILPPGTAEPVSITSDRMVYFAMPSPSDPWGAISPIGAIAESVNTDDDILKSQRAMFNRGIFPGHAIVVGKYDENGLRPRLTKQQQDQIIGAVKRRYQGSINHHEPLILDGLIDDVKTLTTSAREMDWQSSAEQVKARILQAFGTSPYLLGGSEPGSRAASAVAWDHFHRTTVNPLIRLMSQAMSEWMPSMFGEEGIKVEIELAVADDVEMQNARAQILCSSKAIFANELRTMMGLPEDPQFDQVIVGQNGSQEQQAMESAIRGMVVQSLGGIEADSILDRVRGYGHGRRANGNGHSRLLDRQ